MSALKSAGYDVKLFEREGDDDTTFIEVDTGVGVSQVRFADCAPAVPDFCETLVLSTWWDRETPMSNEAVAAANKKNQYVSVFLAADGDPVMQWAILTRREGIPATVFLNAIQRFSGIARDYRDLAFESDVPRDDPVSTTNESSESDGSDAE
ncbi:YbjN domain-containing protein [Erythrobacter ani]|uniref:YbjN domain-containing protein n=1 Tax=Erythrobacter ani TaxID=2827235 RepID=A0ABS6SP88_9SPHN|nr:YbjN domain-containing protein [Erythrobacter ani]MBV7266851.1 YbjN domain-containing protein [Erythrobacter ani]